MILFSIISTCLLYTSALADYRYRTEKYLCRIVTSANQLVEKIQIFDAGKDDRVMELVKLLATDSILKNDPDIEFDELRFACLLYTSFHIIWTSQIRT